MEKMPLSRHLALFSMWRRVLNILDIDTQLESLEIKDSRVIKSHQMLSENICID